MRSLVKVLLALVGAVCTWCAAVNFDRLQVDGAAVGPGDYALYVALPLVGTLLFAVGRIALRFVGPPATKTAGRNRRRIGKIAADYAMRGDVAGLDLVKDIARHDVEVP